MENSSLAFSDVKDVGFQPLEVSGLYQMMRFCGSDAQKTALLPMLLPPLFPSDSHAEPTCGHICYHFSFWSQRSLGLCRDNAIVFFFFFFF